MYVNTLHCKHPISILLFRTKYTQQNLFKKNKYMKGEVLSWPVSFRFIPSDRHTELVLQESPNRSHQHQHWSSKDVQLMGDSHVLSWPVLELLFGLEKASRGRRAIFCLSSPVALYGAIKGMCPTGSGESLQVQPLEGRY